MEIVMNKNVMIEMIEHELFTATKSLSVALKLFEEVKKLDNPLLSKVVNILKI
jgi:hypothetical protein